MTIDRIEEMLKSYRFEVGRCGHLEQDIAQVMQDIEKAKASLVSDLVGPGAQVITDMPRGTTVGNPTEKYGLMLAGGWVSEDIQELESKLADMEAEYKERKKTVDYVDRWLAGLPERERWMIETQYIDGVIWREIVLQYQEKFGEYRSKDTLKRIRDKAIELICDMAE